MVRRLRGVTEPTAREAVPVVDHVWDLRANVAAYKAVFTVHATAGTVVYAYQDCYQVAVTVHGKPQPRLHPSPRFLPDSERFMRQALHVQPPNGTG
jgi:hypothetical protein